MTPAYRFRTAEFTPPGGLFFYETHGKGATGRTLAEITPKVQALMERFSIRGTPEYAVAEYMCPRVPGLPCVQLGTAKARGTVAPKEAMANSLPYCALPPAAPATAKARIETCIKCPRHERRWCPTCAGHADAADREFAKHGKQRPRTGLDSRSGVCSCAKAYELVVASVEYGDGDPVWDGTPETCWRYQRVDPDLADSNAAVPPRDHVESHTRA